MQFDLYAVITKRVTDMLDQGVVPWRSPILGRGTAGHPKNLESGKPYRGVNVFLLAFTAYAKGYESSYWVTFNQAKARGGTVRKGEKSSMVVFWKQYETEDRQTHQPTKVPVLRYYNVFNAEQCEGLVVPDAPKFEPIDFKPIEMAEAIAKGYEGAPALEHGGSQAFYRPSEDKVRIPEPSRFRSAEEFYSTLYHEYAHNADSRIMPSRSWNKRHGWGFGRQPCGIIRAILGTRVACHRAGIVRVSMDRRPHASGPVL